MANQEIGRIAAEFARKAGKTFFENVRKAYHALEPEIKTAIQEHWVELLALLIASDLDPDSREKRTVYRQIAEFFNKNYELPLPEAIGATHELCGEREEAVLNDGIAAPENVVEQIRADVLAIKVKYQTSDRRNLSRRLEIWYVVGDDPVVHSVDQTLSWEDLPSGVRESKIRDGEEDTTFKLFPGEE